MCFVMGAWWVMVGTVRRVGGFCSVEDFMNACAQTTQHTAMFCCASTTIYVAAPRHVSCNPAC